MLSMSHHRGVPPLSLLYFRLSPVARVAGLGCLEGDTLMGCVPARLSPVPPTAPGDIFSGLRCSLAGL